MCHQYCKKGIIGNKKVRGWVLVRLFFVVVVMLVKMKSRLSNNSCLFIINAFQRDNV